MRSHSTRGLKESAKSACVILAGSGRVQARQTLQVWTTCGMSVRHDSSTPLVRRAFLIASAVACHHLKCSFLRISLRSVSVPYLIARSDLWMSKLIHVSWSLSLLLFNADLRSVGGRVLLVDLVGLDCVSAAAAADRGPFGISDCSTVLTPGTS